jgi:hypothetical protein
MTDSEIFIDIHDTLKNILETNDYQKLLNYINSFNEYSTDIVSIKSILVNTKSLKNDINIFNIRQNLETILDIKLKQT